MERMKVLLIEPMTAPRVVEIEHTLEEMQKLVGGAIGLTYPWEDMVGLVYADDAVFLGYPLNRVLTDDDGKPYDVLKGSFFIAGLDEDNFCTISDEQAAKFSDLFRYPEMFLKSLDNHVICIRVGSHESPIQLT